MSEPMQDRGLPEGPIVGIIGEAGQQGRGLAKRFGAGGVEVIVGSRSVERDEAAAAELGHGVRGASNESCAEASDVVVIAVPWEGHRDQVEALAKELAGKIVECVNPLASTSRGPTLHTLPRALPPSLRASFSRTPPSSRRSTTCLP